MIIAHDNRWCICTPKKTGTHSLNSVLTQRTDYGFVQSPWHGRQWSGNGTRILVVRNPYDRFVSMYYFVKRVKSAWLKNYDFDFELWANAFFSHPIDTNPDWRLNLVGYHAEFKPDVFWKTENLDAELDGFAERFKLQLPPVSDLNSTKSRPSAEEALAMLSRETRSLLDDWAQPDMEMFRYA